MLALIQIGLCALIAGCGTMHQSRLPSVTVDAAAGLPEEIRAIPIDAALLNSQEQAAEIAPSRPGSPPPETLNRWDYRIGRADVLSIVVWDHPQLTIPAGPLRTPAEAGNTVHPDGTIFYPFIGTLHVVGKTVTEVRQAIAAGLSKVIPNPQVDVSVAKYGSKRMYISGAVATPRSIPVTNIPVTLMDAVELAQGFTESADLTSVKLLRGGVEYRLNMEHYLRRGDRRQNPRLEADDLIVVEESLAKGIYVLGEVDQPGTVPIISSLQRINLTDAIAKSGGIDKQNANASGIFVFRSVPAEQAINVYQLDVRDPIAFLLGTRFQLAINDVVYVTSAPAARWNRVVSNILPSVNTLLLIDNATD